MDEWTPELLGAMLQDVLIGVALAMILLLFATPFFLRFFNWWLAKMGPRRGPPRA